MAHARSLRAIGQSLEILRIEAFVLEKDGDHFTVRSEALTPSSQWIVRSKLVEKVLESQEPDPTSSPSRGGQGWLRYEPLDISWLDARGRKKRRSRAMPQIWRATKVSHLLRTLGQHLDRLEVSAFNISLTPESVTVGYRTPSGDHTHESFGMERLRQQGFHMKFRRSRRSGRR